MTQLVVMGFAARDARGTLRKALTELASQLSESAGVELGVSPLSSYAELTQRLHHGEIDVAWVPPVPLVSLIGHQRVVPVATLHRDQLVHFRTALIVPTDAATRRIEELAGKHVAWVDPHSAAGYVVARIELAARGIGPKNLGAESFLGSHEAVVREVAAKRVDFGASFARISRSGDVAGWWSEAVGLEGSIRVIATFGDIPPDAVAFRSDLEPGVARALRQAFFDLMDGERGRALVKAAFGADALRPFEATLYDPFRASVFGAHRAGLLDASTVFDAPSVEPDATTEHRPVEALGDGDLVEEVPPTSDSSRPAGRSRK